MKSLIDKLLSNKVNFISEKDMLTYETNKNDLLAVMNELKNNSELLFSQLTDLCAVDYSAYGQSEWQTKESTSTGYNRGIIPKSNARKHYEDDSDLNNEINYCVVYHLLSVRHNKRIRIKVMLRDNMFIDSVTHIWNSANWYEREAFDLFGILFNNHPDLRRLLTDYGFVGHPFRKDFPLIGNTQIRYDPKLKKIIQEKVDIEPRVLVPRVIRDK